MSPNTLEFLTWTAYAIVSGGIGYAGWRAIQKMDSSRPGKKSSAGKAGPVRTIQGRAGLKSDILKEGSGPGAKNRDSLTVHFEAFLASGEKVDSSYDRGRTLTFKLGTGAVISGWDQALQGMKVGERRKVNVPAEMAYGKKGKSKVPPNATIIFDIELLSIE